MKSFKILFEDAHGKRASMVLGHATLSGAVAIAAARALYREEFKSMVIVGVARTNINLG